jgi:Sulfatase
LQWKESVKENASKRENGAMDRVKAILALSIIFGAGCLPAANAQQTSGVQCSPDATTTIDGRYLPAPPQKFEGQINLNAAQSKPAWPSRVVPPKGAPNIVLILTDDVGFCAPSTFGGVIPTPSMDRIAAAGLRYTNFHSTSLCSPTRAAIITGRNHHSVGFGVISEVSMGFPGYDSVIGKDSATIGRTPEWVKKISDMHLFDKGWNAVRGGHD